MRTWSITDARALKLTPAAKTKSATGVEPIAASSVERIGARSANAIPSTEAAAVAVMRAVRMREAGRLSLWSTPTSVVPRPSTEIWDSSSIADTAAPASPTALSGYALAAIHQKTKPVVLVTTLAPTRPPVVVAVRRNGPSRSAKRVSTAAAGGGRSCNRGLDW